ncbi:MAG: hypothetical protein JWN51_3146 [Phycisphaerales bacterium]|jgi:hypothetical protein|nr:hypothetical protein [Phycisphaerales bacterium]
MASTKSNQRGGGAKAGGRGGAKSARPSGGAKARGGATAGAAKGARAKASTGKSRGASKARPASKAPGRSAARPKSEARAARPAQGGRSQASQRGEKSQGRSAAGGSAKRRSGASTTRDRAAERTKVGSSTKAADRVGGALDFGIPADRARGPVEPGGYGKGPDPGTGPMRSDSRGVRTTGVGWAPGPDGAGSGGDVDSDIIGLDGRGGVALDPGERRTQGPDITEGGSAAFASGRPAPGRNERPRGGVGGPRPVLDTVDHSGGDATTSGAQPDDLAEPQSEQT